jgi:hypothetical protein
MDAQRSAADNSRTSVLINQIKKLVAILSIISFVVLEIYISYSISNVNSGRINPNNFRCDQSIDIGNQLHVNICNKLISIFQNWNNTLKQVSLTDTEWFTLTQLLR